MKKKNNYEICQRLKVPIAYTNQKISIFKNLHRMILWHTHKQNLGITKESENGGINTTTKNALPAMPAVLLEWPHRNKHIQIEPPITCVSYTCQLSPLLMLLHLCTQDTIYVNAYYKNSTNADHTLGSSTLRRHFVTNHLSSAVHKSLNLEHYNIRFSIKY